MERWSQWISNPAVAWAVVGSTVLATGLAAFAARGLQQEDDLLAFLPARSEEVRLFRAISESFGTTDVALVGLEADDVFEPEFLTRLESITSRVEELEGVRYVLSLSTVNDFAPDPELGGIIAAPLVDRIPTTDAERQSLRERVLERRHIVGNLVSANGRAVLLYVYLAFGADPREVSAQIEDAVSAELGKAKAYWGGAPFVSSYVYNVTQEDLSRLTPWAVLVIVLIMVLAFRDLLGACLVLLATGMGVVLSLGLMVLTGASFNIVLSSMPVVLFAVGSAYSVHIVVRFTAARRVHPTAEALRRVMVVTGSVVWAAGLTTVVSLLSFLMMDIEPVRTFGLFTAAGIFLCLILSLTFVPAVLVLTSRERSSGEEAGPLARALAGVAALSARRRGVVIGAIAAIGGLGALGSARVDTLVDNAAFFQEDSPPHEAEAFLRKHFGGGEFVQLRVRGDLTSPLVLRELQGLSDELSGVDGVSSVTHIGVPLTQVAAAMTGFERIPDTSEQVAALFGFLHDTSVTQLINPERTEGLVLIRLSVSNAHDVQTVLSTLEARIDNWPKRWDTVAGASEEGRTSLAALVARRAHRIQTEEGLPSLLKAEEMASRLVSVEPRPQPGLVTEALGAFLMSRENPVELSGREEATAVAGAVTALGAAAEPEALVAAIASVTERSAIDVEDLAFGLETRAEDAWRMGRARARLQSVIGGTLSPAVAKRLRMALLDLETPQALVASQDGAVELGIDVSGLPVMYRGLSRSVRSNQIYSLAFALGLVVLILTWFFRSITGGLLAALPTIITLAVVYGLMGIVGIRLDIGTSMLASIILGAGVDYAVHLVAAWQSRGNEETPLVAGRAAAESGPAIATNALMIAAGFFVLTLGEAKPLQNVGALTAGAMVVAAWATFFAIPALARRPFYRAARVWGDETVSAAEGGDHASHGTPVGPGSGG